MQIIVMTSDKSDWTLGGFQYLFNRYWSPEQEVTVVGFRKPPVQLASNFKFVSLGNMYDYPANKWSNAFLRVLDEVADDQFVLMLDDYWIVRNVDARGVKIAFDYMRQFGYVMKFDLTHDRLYSDPGRYHYGFNTYSHAGHLDLIKSDPGRQYHMSLWGGIWNKNVVRQFIVPDETAQQIELNGTARVSQAGDSILVIGSRQCPVLHGNILQSGKKRVVLDGGGWKVSQSDVEMLVDAGLLDLSYRS